MVAHRSLCGVISSAAVRFAIVLLLLTGCSSRPVPVSPPSTPAPPAPGAPQATEQRTRTVYVTASALNVREQPSTGAEVVTQLKKNAPLAVVGSDEAWLKVRLEDGRVGWVAERFVSEEKGQARQQQSSKKRSGCESDYAFLQTPALSFSQEDAHGLVVVEANVNAKGVVTSTKVVTNKTGNPDAGAVAEREIRSAKFAPPIRDCVPRPFIFTYRRTF
ncbi:MAG: N-acetylmuramoyl-L-alanine amidase [Acidobacteriota bacterium]|jgi:uncharacterized protein YgiM (DUF1202 family)|nr:N-acetylmuramoyl-L-alanine amidase [Acidobacteriota bacterium]